MKETRELLANIALYFAAEQVKGYRLVSTQCPVANWLYREGCSAIGVANTYIADHDETIPLIKDYPAVHEFTVDFDLDKYPELKH